MSPRKLRASARRRSNIELSMFLRQYHFCLSILLFNEKKKQQEKGLPSILVYSQTSCESLSWKTVRPKLTRGVLREYRCNKRKHVVSREFPLLFLTIGFYRTLRDAKASVDMFSSNDSPETNKTLPKVLNRPVFCSSSLVWYNNVLIRNRSGGLSQR